MKLSNIYKSLRKDWREMKRKAIIELIKERGMMSSKELAKELGLSTSTIVSTARQLKEITRVVTSEGPKYMLTSDYEKLKDRVLEVIKEMKRVSVAVLSEKSGINDYRLVMDILNDLEILDLVRIIYDKDMFVEV